MIRVFAIDDEEPFRRLLKKELARKGFHCDVAPDGESGLKALRKESYDVVLLDIIMPGVDGITLMKKIKGDPAAPAIIVLTGKATIETAVQAMRNGAYDYLTKPYKLDELEIIINRAYEYGRLSEKSSRMQQALLRQDPGAEEGMVGESPSFVEVLALTERIAPTGSTVLVLGESGTGKELIANAIWRGSARASNPFTALNCATLSENLMESELFGHEKGAFTTAYQRKYGIVEVADHGTLFLDEIAEMSLALQAKLLRFLDSGEFRRVGGHKPMRVDVRIIAATNKDLKARVKAGAFREDLFYRLNVISITVPPLRERVSDISLLASHFLGIYARKLQKDVTGISPEALKKLVAYDWPGNVRELENEMERAAILCDTPIVQPGDLTVPVVSPEAEQDAYPLLEDMERQYIARVLRQTGGNQSKASRILGINRKTLHLKLKKYGLSPEK